MTTVTRKFNFIEIMSALIFESGWKGKYEY